MDYKALYEEHFTLAALALRKLLEEDPRNIDALSELDMAIVRQAHGSSFLDRTMNRASQVDRLEREAERVNRPDENTKRVKFEMEEYAAAAPPLDDSELAREFTR